MSEFPYKGYAGQYLEVNLTTGKIVKKILPKELAKAYLGGTGFAAKILWDRVKPGIDPLGLDNVLVFATGPITGTFFPPAGRFMVAAKSPLTGIWGEAHCGGHFGPEIKYAGYDMVVFEGKAEKPVYLYIDDDYVELKDATHLWGKTTRETTKSIQEELGDDSIKVACIGPAGENKVRFACVIVDFYRAAGRTGMGAVMGSKNLKAIAVRGTRSITVADPDKFFELAVDGLERETKSKLGLMAQESLGKTGTPSLVELENEIGRLPTKNHWTGTFKDADKISGETIRKKYRTSRESCFSCGIQCKFISHVSSGPYKGTLSGGPEYESIFALGSNCMVSDVEAVLHANMLCNEYGLDTISTGKVISFAMECYEHEIITKEDTDGLDLTWGNAESEIQLIHKIAKREGFGNLLAEGVKRAAEKIGKGAEKFALHVKGLECSGQDPRGQYSVGLTYAVNVRGADHLRSLSCYEELGYPDVAAERYGSDKAEEIMNLRSPKYKAMVVLDLEDLYAIVDSLIICKYGTMWPPIYYWDDFAKIIPALTGMKEYSDIEYVKKVGARISTLRKAFNVREGLDRKDDTLPERFLKEPMPEGPAKGHTCPLDIMLDEYYELRGWNKETGIPTRKSLEELDLSDVADELEKMGRLA